MVLTMDSARQVYRRGAVAVDGSRIVEVGQEDDLSKKYNPRKILRSDSFVTMPGLVTAHTHMFQVLYRGLGDERSLYDWVSEMIFPLSRHLDRENLYWGGLLCQLELLRGGVTCLSDSHFIHRDPQGIDSLAQAVQDSGIRAVLGRACTELGDFTDIFVEDVETAVQEVRRVFETWNGKADGRIVICPEVAVPMLASDRMQRELRELADAFQTGLHYHAAETAFERQEMVKKTGKGVIEYLDVLGVLEPDVLLAHAIWLSQREMDIIRDRDVKIAHNPVSNQYLADGVAPVPGYLSRGVTVGIGVDGAASNNNQDMFAAMKHCALMHKLTSMDAEVLTAYKVLEMSTRDGARALGLENEIGSLEAGKKADIILVSTDKPHLAPNHNPISNLVYAGSGQDVDTVIVDGKVVVDAGTVKTVDSDRVLEESTRAAKSILEKAGKESLTRVPSVEYL